MKNSRNKGHAKISECTVIVDKRIKPRPSFKHLKHAIQEFYRKAANNVVVVYRLHVHYIDSTHLRFEILFNHLIRAYR